MNIAELFETVTVDSLLSKLDKEGTVSYLTAVTLTGGKKNEQQGHIVKVTNDLPVEFIGKGGGYAAARQEQDPDFVVQPRKWGVRTADGLIEHNGELYVEFLVKGRGTTTYLFDGKPIEKDKIVGLKPSTSTKEDDTGITLRCIKVSSIINID